MESIIVIIMIGCLLSTFVFFASYIIFKLDSHKRAIDKLIEKRIFDENIKKQEREKNGMPVGSNIPTNLEIERYFA